MAKAAKKLPPEFQTKALRIDAALNSYIEELRLLQKQRRAVTQGFLNRVESVKIEEAKKWLQSL